MNHLTYKLLAAVPALVFAVLLSVIRLAVGSEHAAAWIAAAICIVVAVLTFALRKRYSNTKKDDTAAVTLFSVITGFLLPVCLITSVYYTAFAPMEERSVVVNSLVFLLTCAFTLLAAIHFLLSALAPSLVSNPAVRLGLAMMPVLFFAFRILTDFIATGTMPLANGGGYHILGMIATMLFFLCECKQIAESGKVFVRLACGQTAIILNAAYGIPLLVSFFSGTSSVTDAMYAALFLAVSLYIAARLANSSPATQTEE